MRAELGNRVSLSVASSIGTVSLRPIIGQGRPGLNGSNVLPTDEAMANGVANAGDGYPLFSAALAGAIAEPLDNPDSTNGGEAMIVHDAGTKLVTIRGAIRNDGPGVAGDGSDYWSCIIDDNHGANVGVTSIVTGTANVNINFTRNLGKRVSCAVTPDETMVANGFTVGASFSSDKLQLTFSRHRVLTDELTWNGTAWAWAQGGRFSDFFSTTLSASTSIGATTISSPISIADGQTITIDTAGNAETVTVNGPPTGSGPYTIHVPPLAIAHSSGVAVVGSTDSGGVITLRHESLKGRGMTVTSRAGSGSPAARYEPMLASTSGSTASANMFSFALYDRTSVQWVQIGTLSSAASIGNLSISSSVTIPSGTLLRLNTGTLYESFTTTGGPSGSGPYTVPVPALTKAHASGVGIYTQKVVDSVVTSRAAADANNLRCVVARAWEGAVNPMTDITTVKWPNHNVWFEATAHLDNDDLA